MIKTASRFLLLIFFTFVTLSLESKPMSVVIVGGGPSGLATAIEAFQSGANVTILEKRDSYSRPQTLFLWESSLKLFEKWDVYIPQMGVYNLGNGERIGIVPIKHLEEALESKVKSLDIKKIQGEFKDFIGDRKIIFTNAENKSKEISYDILIGADGTHSAVRNKLAVDCFRRDTAKAAVAFMRLDKTEGGFGITETMKKNDLFVRKISTPSASIVFVQTCPGVSCKIEQTQFETALHECGFVLEASLLKEGNAKIADNIDVYLQQAKTFYNETRATLIVGDAAASASFFEGMGANVAFRTAEHAGEFFRQIQTSPQMAYLSFDQQMKSTTDELVAQSSYLFD